MHNSFKNPLILIPFLGLVLISITLFVQHRENDIYKDPIKIGQYFTYATIICDKEEAQAISDKNINHQLNCSPIDEGLIVGANQLYMTNYKRVADRVVATYSLMEVGKAWHYTLVLAPIKEPTWYENLKRKIYDDLPFGNKIMSLPTREPRWLVTDFYTKDKFNIDEYAKLISDEWNSNSKKTSDEVIKSWDNERINEEQFYKSFTRVELIKQNEETKKLINYYYKDISIGSKPYSLNQAELNPKELEEYYAVYKNPFVVYLRRSLDAYVANDIGNFNISETAIKSGRKEGEMSGLDAFDKSYYKSKFIVVSINKSIAGGVDIFIAFQDKPDKVFYAWVYPLSGGDYELRAFNFNEKVFDAKAMEGFRVTSEQFLKDKDHAL